MSNIIDIAVKEDGQTIILRSISLDAKDERYILFIDRELRSVVNKKVQDKLRSLITEKMYV